MTSASAFVALLLLHTLNVLVTAFNVDAWQQGRRVDADGQDWRRNTPFAAYWDDLGAVVNDKTDVVVDGFSFRARQSL